MRMAVAQVWRQPCRSGCAGDHDIALKKPCRGDSPASPLIRHGCLAPDLFVALVGEPLARALRRRCSGVLPMCLVSRDDLCLRSRHDCHQILDLWFHPSLTANPGC
jgi:hypothetical protein